MQRRTSRTPTKVRSRRESFRLDEIPTKDTPPLNHHRSPSRQSARMFHPNNSRPAFRRTTSLDFTSNSKVPDYQRRHSENHGAIVKSFYQHPLIDRLDKVLTASSGSNDEFDEAEDGDDDEDDENDDEEEDAEAEAEDDDDDEDDNDQQDDDEEEEAVQGEDSATMTNETFASALNVQNPVSSNQKNSTSKVESGLNEQMQSGRNSKLEYDAITQHLTRRNLKSGSSTQHLSRPNSKLESDTSTLNLSRQIYDMWRHQQLCDVVLIVDEDKEMYHAHKLVLATTCDAVADMGKGSGSSSEFHIPKVCGKVMKQALRYFYTGKLEVCEENVEELLEIGRHLRSNKLTNQCRFYLLDVNMVSSVRNRVIALKYELHDVVASIDGYMQEHFTSLVSSDTFLRSNFQIIYDIISSDMLTTPDELQLFHACASWINFDPDERLGYAVPLMALIRFNSITPENIVSQVEPVLFMTSITECKDMLYKAFRHHSLFRDLIRSVSMHAKTRSPMSGSAAPRSTPCYRSPGSTPPSQQSDSAHDTESIIQQQESTDKAHKEVLSRKNVRTEPRKQLKFREVMKRVQNEIRRQKQEKAASRNIVNDVRDSRRKSIASKQSTQRQQSSSSTSSHTVEPPPDADKPKLAPTKGLRAITQKVIAAQRFRDKQNKMQHKSTTELDISPITPFTGKMTGTRSQSSGVIKTPSGSQNELSPILAGSDPFNMQMLPAPSRPPIIFAMGGVNPYYKEEDGRQININQSIQQYIPATNSWSIVIQMPQPLHHFAVTTSNDKVYVTGGQKSCTNSDELPTRDCFVYDAIQGKWEPIAFLKTARARHVAVTLNDVVYVLGGVDCVQMSLKSMEYYEQDEAKWYFTQPMKDARLDLAAVAHRGKILVAGGMCDVDEKRLLNTVEIFDPSTGNWTSKSRFPLHIAGGSMVDVKGVAYFVCGYVMQDGKDLSVDSVFRYCDETDSWNGYQALRVPRHAALVSVIGCRIYVIGGESSASLGHALTNVECIDVDTKEHVPGIAPLLSPAYGISGCSLN